MTDITSDLRSVTGGATAKHYSQPTHQQPTAPTRNPINDCAMGALGASMFGASPITGCIAGAASGGGNSLLDAFMSM
ncbi:MAG TPA: hypothetical protein VGG28_17420 [Kofleriaceae bacterium]